MRAKVIDLPSSQEIQFQNYYIDKSSLPGFEEYDEEYPWDPWQFFAGNRLYRPPESFEGWLTPRHDVWSAGLIAYSIFTGEHLLPVGGPDGRILKVGEISLDDKRAYAEGMNEWIKRDKKEIQRYITQRIQDDPSIPQEWKKPLLYTCKVSPNTRRNMVNILPMIGCEMPERPHPDNPHNHWVEDEPDNCFNCTMDTYKHDVDAYLDDNPDSEFIFDGVTYDEYKSGKFDK